MAAQTPIVVDLINSTGKYVYVDVIHENLSLQHLGLFAPGEAIRIHGRAFSDGSISAGNTNKNTSQHYTVYSHVYVKSHQTEDAGATICYATKTFRGDDGQTFVEHIRFQDGKCFIQ